MELQRLQALESRNPGVLFGSQALSVSTFLGPGLSQKCAHSLFLLPFLTSLPPSLCFCWSTTCSQHFHLTNSVCDICQTDLICWSSSASSAASQSCISETGILDNILAVEMSWPRRAHTAKPLPSLGRAVNLGQQQLRLVCVWDVGALSLFGERNQWPRVTPEDSTTSPPHNPLPRSADGAHNLEIFQDVITWQTLTGGIEEKHSNPKLQSLFLFSRENLIWRIRIRPGPCRPSF